MTAFLKVTEALTILEDVQEKIERVRSMLRPIAAQGDEPDIGGRVLAEVLEQGGSVTKEDLYRIAAGQGMDRRGLGGFFRQSGKTSLYVLPGDRVLLTPYGAEQARRYAQRDPLVYEPGEPNLAKIAEESFAEDWDSDEEGIYDNA